MTDQARLRAGNSTTIGSMALASSDGARFESAPNAQSFPDGRLPKMAKSAQRYPPKPSSSQQSGLGSRSNGGIRHTATSIVPSNGAAPAAHATAVGETTGLGKVLSLGQLATSTEEVWPSALLKHIVPSITQEGELHYTAPDSPIQWKVQDVKRLILAARKLGEFGRRQLASLDDALGRLDSWRSELNAKMRCNDELQAKSGAGHKVGLGTTESRQHPADEVSRRKSDSARAEDRHVQKSSALGASAARKELAARLSQSNGATSSDQLDRPAMSSQSIRRKRKHHHRSEATAPGAASGFGDGSLRQADALSKVGKLAGHSNSVHAGSDVSRDGRGALLPSASKRSPSEGFVHSVERQKSKHRQLEHAPGLVHSPESLEGIDRQHSKFSNGSLFKSGREQSGVPAKRISNAGACSKHSSASIHTDAQKLNAAAGDRVPSHTQVETQCCDGPVFKKIKSSSKTKGSKVTSSPASHYQPNDISVQKSKAKGKSKNGKSSKSAQRDKTSAMEVAIERLAEADMDIEYPAAAAYISEKAAPVGFWRSVEPYFAPVLPEHFAQLEPLDPSQPLHIPTLGDHYTKVWAAMECAWEDGLDELVKRSAFLTGGASSLVLAETKPGLLVDGDDQRAPAGSDLPFESVSQRLVAALIGDTKQTQDEPSQCIQLPMPARTNSHSEVSSKPATEGPDVSMKCPTACAGEDWTDRYRQLTLDERLVLELQSAGLLDDAAWDISEREDDEICAEMRRCHERLSHQVEVNNVACSKLEMTVRGRAKAEEKYAKHLCHNRLLEMAHERRLGKRGAGPSTAVPFSMPSSALSGQAGAPTSHKLSRQLQLQFAQRVLDRHSSFRESNRFEAFEYASCGVQATTAKVCRPQLSLELPDAGQLSISSTPMTTPRDSQVTPIVPVLRLDDAIGRHQRPQKAADDQCLPRQEGFGRDSDIAGQEQSLGLERRDSSLTAWPAFSVPPAAVSHQMRARFDVAPNGMMTQAGNVVPTLQQPQGSVSLLDQPNVPLVPTRRATPLPTV
eukprot:jgi/Chlat1/2114/Chrsp17S02709